MCIIFHVLIKVETCIPNYEVWYFGAKSIILWEPKIFSSHLHSIRPVQQPAPEISSTQHINTGPVHRPVNSTSDMLLSPGLFPSNICNYHSDNILICIINYVIHGLIFYLLTYMVAALLTLWYLRNQYVRQRQLSYVASIKESFLLNI